jgi:hypothetical protein
MSGESPTFFYALATMFLSIEAQGFFAYCNAQNFSFMRILNFTLAVMFLIFAFVQVNDPDPAIWILIYGAMAVISIMAIFEFYPKRVIIGLLIVYTLYSFVYLPGVLEWLRQDNKALLFDDLAKMQFPYIEEAREFLGLFICVAVLLFYTLRSRRK